MPAAIMKAAPSIGGAARAGQQHVDEAADRDEQAGKLQRRLRRSPVARPQDSIAVCTAPNSSSAPVAAESCR